MPPQNPTMLGTSFAMAVSIRVLPSCAPTVNSAPCASTKVTLIMAAHIHQRRLSHQTIRFVATTYFAFDTRAATSIRDGLCRTRVSRWSEGCFRDFRASDRSDRGARPARAVRSWRLGGILGAVARVYAR